MIIFDHSLPIIVIGASLAAALGAVMLSFWRHRGARRFGLVLTALRLSFLALLGWCLLQPQRRESRTQLLRPRFVVALDTSQSMLLTPSAEVPSRWAAARGLLGGGWRRVTAAECVVDACSVAGGLGPRLALEEAEHLVPDGAATLLRNGIQALADRYRGQNVAGVLLLSDGVDTREVRDEWAVGPWPFPVYTVQLEPAAVWEVEPDVRVDRVDTARRVPVGWKTELKAIVSGQGTGGEEVPVQLLRDGEGIDDASIRIPAEGGSRELAFVLEHPRVGVFTYEVRVPGLPGESQTSDNQYSVSVQVVDAANRLLYVEGPPRWESKYLARLLTASRQVTALVFIRGPDQKFWTLGAREGLTPDLDEQQLALFKIVILGNLSGAELGPERAARVETFVAGGGSLILLGGPKAWDAAGFGATPLAALLPVQGAAAPAEGRYAVALTDEGRAHPVFAGAAGEGAGLPPVLSLFAGLQPAPGAQTLLVAEGPQGAQPVVVTQRYGEGRVAALLTDSLWRWKLDPSSSRDPVYDRFWTQLLAWLSPAEETLAEDRIELFPDKEQLYLGEEVVLSARVAAPAGTAEADPPGRVQCEITLPDGRAVPFVMARREVPAGPSGRAGSGYEVTFPSRAPGLHAARVVIEREGGPVRSDPVSFFVKPYTPESVPRPANLDVLRALARGSGGRFLENVEEADRYLSSLQFHGAEEERVEYRSLWRSFWVLPWLLGLLSAEWGLRKWRNLP